MSTLTLASMVSLPSSDTWLTGTTSGVSSPKRTLTQLSSTRQTTRKVNSDATIAVSKVVFEVPQSFIGSQVTVGYDPTDLSRAHIMDQNFRICHRLPWSSLGQRSHPQSSILEGTHILFTFLPGGGQRCIEPSTVSLTIHLQEHRGSNIYESSVFKEFMARMEHFKNAKGFAVVYGESGSGKTTAIRAFAATSTHNSSVVYLPSPLSLSMTLQECRQRPWHGAVTQEDRHVPSGPARSLPTTRRRSLHFSSSTRLSHPLDIPTTSDPLQLPDGFPKLLHGATGWQPRFIDMLESTSMSLFARGLPFTIALAAFRGTRWTHMCLRCSRKLAHQNPYSHQTRSRPLPHPHEDSLAR